MPQEAVAIVALDGCRISPCLGSEQAPSEPLTGQCGLLQHGTKALTQEQQQCQHNSIESASPSALSSPASPAGALQEGFNPMPQVPMCRFCLEEEDEGQTACALFFDVPAASCSNASGSPQDIESQRLLTSSCSAQMAYQPPTAPSWISTVLARMQQGKRSSLPEPTKPHQQRRRRKNPLIAPCLCTGSSKYVHVACLQKWRDSSPAAFQKCTVCGYEYRFKQTRSAAFFRSAAIAPAALVLLLIALCWTLGYLPAWKPDDNWITHFINGFVMVGLTGFVLTLADVFSNRRAVSMLTWLEEWVGRELSVAYTYLAISVFQLLAVALLITCLVVSSLWSWGVVILAALGLNQLSCGPLLSGLRKMCDNIAERLDMQTSRMIVHAVAPDPVARHVELQQHHAGTQPCMASPASVLAGPSSSATSSCAPSPSVPPSSQPAVLQALTGEAGSSSRGGSMPATGDAVQDQIEHESMPLLQVVVRTEQEQIAAACWSEAPVAADMGRQEDCPADNHDIDIAETMPLHAAAAAGSLA